MGRPRLRAALPPVLTALAAAASLGAAPATAAPVYVTVGQTAPAGDALAEGGCTTCNAIPYASATAPSSAFPFDGVITRWSVRTRTIGNPLETVRPRIWRHTDATTSQLIAQGAVGTLTTPNTIQTFWDRVPATGGDLLGARFDTGAGIDETAPLFTNGTTAGDVAVRPLDAPPMAVGGTTTTPAVANRRVNIAARFERDEDADGYGDGSQDLCTGDGTRAVTACSGTLFGSDLQGPYQRVGFTCPFACVRVQRTLAGGAPTVVTARGVVVRWRLQAPVAGTYRLRVIEPAPGGGFRFAGGSDAVTVGPDEALLTYPARVTVPAGGYVGLVPPTFTIQTSLLTPPAGATFSALNDAADGTATSFSAPAAGVVMYDADVEADADADGFGDETQDACPADAATQGPCPVVPPPPPPPLPPSPPPGTTTPTGTTTPATPAAAILALSMSRTRFAVARRGRVITRAAAAAGTTVRVRLTRGARVRFTVRRLVGTRAVPVHAFARTLAAGRSSTPYSARYRRAGRTRSLRRGRHRLEAAVLSPAGRPGTPVRRSFTVVR